MLAFLTVGRDAALLLLRREFLAPSDDAIIVAVGTAILLPLNGVADPGPLAELKVTREEFGEHKGIDAVVGLLTPGGAVDALPRKELLASSDGGNEPSRLLKGVILLTTALAGAGSAVRLEVRTTPVTP